MFAEEDDLLKIFPFISIKMCPKFESDDENFFKLEGIIEIKNDRKLQDKVELSQIFFGRKTTHQMDKEFDTEIIDEKL